MTDYTFNQLADCAERLAGRWRISRYTAWLIMERLYTLDGQGALPFFVFRAAIKSLMPAGLDAGQAAQDLWALGVLIPGSSLGWFTFRDFERERRAHANRWRGRSLSLYRSRREGA